MPKINGLSAGQRPLAFRLCTILHANKVLTFSAQTINIQYYQTTLKVSLLICILSLILAVTMSIVGVTLTDPIGSTRTSPDRGTFSSADAGYAPVVSSLQGQPPGPAHKPVARNEDPTWVRKHLELLERAKRGNIELYFAGDSITRRWEGEVRHKANWDQNFGGWKSANFGAGGDLIQNLLYRIENGELDGVNPQVIVLLIGTNNVGFVPVEGSNATLVEDTTKGIKACLNALRQKAPKAKILLMGITPRNTNGTTALMPTINQINSRIAKFADGKTIKYLNINDKLADNDGSLHDGLTEDGLHLTNKGYQVWADAMKPILIEWLGPPRAGRKLH